MPGGKAQLLRSVDQSRALSILGSSPVSRRTSHRSLRCCSGTAQVVLATHITSIRSVAIGRAVDLRHTFVKSSLTSPRHSCRSEEHTSELQSLMRISYAVFFLKIKIII